MYPFAEYEHDPQAILDYIIDWSDWLVGTDTLASTSWTVPTGLVKEAEGLVGTTASIVWLSGGSLGQDYYVVCHVVTTDGREDDRTLLIKSRSL